MPSAPTSYRITAFTAADSHSEILAGTQSIPFDSAWGAATPSGLPGPAELLMAALAGCLLKGLERARAMLPFDYESADVTISARRQDAPPRFMEFEYEVRIVTSETDHRVQLLHRNLQQFGTIYNTLALACDVHGTVVAVRDHPNLPKM